MTGPRADCPVLTCTRSMPTDQVMCAWCWAKVPKSLRKEIDCRRSGITRRNLVAQAIAAAQAVPS